MNLFFSFIFLYYNILGSYSKGNIVHFKFEKYKTNIVNINSLKYRSSYDINNNLNNVSKNNFMFRLLTDDVYFNLTIGSAKQIINTIWNMNQYSFKIYNLSYNENKSNTFKKISENFLYSFDEVKNAITCEDDFYFINEKNTIFKSSFQFIKIYENKNYSFIGLQLPDITTNNLLTFIKEMKKNDVIDKYIFYIIYNENEERIDNPNGIIYFGDYPHNNEILKDKYIKDNYIEIKVAKRKTLAYWDILFDNIYFNKSYNKFNTINKKQVELCGNMQLSIGTDEYQEFIKNNFFNKYIEEKICEEKTILNYTDYIYYKCNKNKNFDIKNFPTLFFELKEINFNFSLNYNDLFFIHDEFYYFGIVFDKFFKLKFEQRWKLGATLFKKYLLIFNQDSKTIGFYNNIINSNNNKNIFEPINNINNNNNKNKNIFNIIIIFGLLIILFFLILFYIIIKRKKRNSKYINYTKTKKHFAHDIKNKYEIHNYYELNNNLI